MTIKPFLAAATLASGVIVTEAPAIYVPSKPSIVQAANLKYSKPLLLGMPITMGMLVNKGPTFTYLSKQAFTNSTGSSISATAAIPAACTFVVVAYTGYIGNNPTTLSTKTLGGLTLNDGVAYSQSNSRAMTAIWYYNNPGTGNKTLTITLSNANQSAQAVIYYFSGSFNASPVGASATTSSTAATSLSRTITTIGKGSFIVGCLSHNASASTGATGTLLGNINFFQGGSDSHAAGYVANSGVIGSYTYGLTMTSAGSDYCQFSVCEFKSA